MNEGITPATWREIAAYLREQRGDAGPMDFIHVGPTPGGDPGEAWRTVEPYIDAGVTWWIESLDPWAFGWKWGDKWSGDMTAAMKQRILQGPPRQPAG
jgi:hypothetical protein